MADLRHLALTAAQPRTFPGAARDCPRQLCHSGCQTHVILSTGIDGETGLWRAGYAMVQRIKPLLAIVFLDHSINQK
jgi:hypothetical protein